MSIPKLWVKCLKMFHGLCYEPVTLVHLRPLNIIEQTEVSRDLSFVHPCLGRVKYLSLFFAGTKNHRTRSEVLDHQVSLTQQVLPPFCPKTPDRTQVGGGWRGGWCHGQREPSVQGSRSPSVLRKIRENLPPSTDGSDKSPEFFLWYFKYQRILYQKYLNLT